MEIPLRIRNTAEGIAAILHLPDSAGSRLPTGLLMVHAQGSTKIGHKRCFVELARILKEEGAPVLRFDLLGEGESEELLRDPYIDWRGLQQVVEYFWNECDLKRLVVLGDCFGGLLGAYYSRLEPRIEHTIIWNLAHMNWTEELLEGYADRGPELDSARILWAKFRTLSWWRDSRWSWTRARHLSAIAITAPLRIIPNYLCKRGHTSTQENTPTGNGKPVSLTVIHASSQPGASRAIAIAEHVFTKLGMEAQHVRIPGVPFSAAWKRQAFERVRRVLFSQP